MLTVGVVGAGFMGQMHANVHSNLPNVKLVGVADIVPSKAAELAGKFGARAYPSFEAMIEGANPDLVDITLPTYLHCEYVLRAAKIGKHILCEKPMARSLAEADRMVAAVKKARVKFMTAHCIRFWPEYVALKQIVDSKKLGKLTSLYLSRMSPLPTWSWNGWLLDPRKSGSALLDLHIHDVDYVLHLLGKPKSVMSVAARSKIGLSHVFTTYQYPGKAVVALGGWDMPAKFPFKMAFRANFEKGTVGCSTGRTPTMLVYEVDKEPYEPEIKRPKAEGAVTGGNLSDLGGYYNEIKYFTDCIAAGKDPKTVTPMDARNSVALVMAEEKSALTGKPVKPALK